MELVSAERMAWELLRKHGLWQWKVSLDRAVRRFGQCDYSKRLITLSAPMTLACPDDEVRDTILHEIAHALTPGDGHGEKWKAACRSVGARDVRVGPAIMPVLGERHHWAATCATCGKASVRYKLPKTKISCGPCSGRYYTSAYDLTWVSSHGHEDKPVKVKRDPRKALLEDFADRLDSVEGEELRGNGRDRWNHGDGIWAYLKTGWSTEGVYGDYMLIHEDTYAQVRAILKNDAKPVAKPADWDNR